MNNPTADLATDPAPAADPAPATDPAPAADPTGGPAAGAQAVRDNLAAFLAQRTRTDVPADADLFESGLVSSLFALQLVVHLEQAFGVEVAGPDLTLDNFRTIEAMTALVLRLRGGADG